jgi:hypothetical protein
MNDPVLAHLGGWDELLMVAGVGALAWLFVRFSERRSQRRAEEEEEEDPSRKDQGV